MGKKVNQIQTSRGPSANLLNGQIQDLIARALAAHQSGQIALAQQLYQKVLDLQPNHFDALHLTGVIAAQTRNFQNAVKLFNRALSIRSTAGAFVNLGNALRELSEYQEALKSYDSAIRLKPDFAEAHSNRGNALQDLKRYQLALESYDRAIALNARLADAHVGRGNALHRIRRQEEALKSYDNAIALKPDLAEAHYSRGVALQELQLFEEALKSYQRTMEIKPDHEFVAGTIVHLKMKLCDWNEIESFTGETLSRIARGEKASNPFPLLALIDSPDWHRRAAEIWVRNKCPATSSLHATSKIRDHDRIRIGYFSADYHNHATAYLMAELFERHDRKKFELIAFSFGQDKNDEMRSRIKAAFDRFIDVREYSDNDVARLSRELEIDIAVDLKGFTKNCRTGIFAARAAPIQVNYLGYPGTMSAEYIDYIIADPTLIPENCKLYYSEKIAYLPHSYQVNDATREVSARTFSRIELGLPETGFVFCCFNNNYKITPSTFNVWMRIMKQVEGSVLWLYEDNPIAAKNLRIEAEKRGISNERLIFARHMSASEHLARHRVADLFLDTSPYNAHTTASDALWTGLPVLTCPGKSFASRVAASLLGAIHLPELVTRSMEEYEALAIELATNPSKLPELKARLDENRLTTPLFDIQLFTKHIENLYLAMYSAKCRNIKFDHIMAVAEN